MWSVLSQERKCSSRLLRLLGVIRSTCIVLCSNADCKVLSTDEFPLSLPCPFYYTSNYDNRICCGLNAFTLLEIIVCTIYFFPSNGLLRLGRLSGGLNDTANRPPVGARRDRDEAIYYQMRERFRDLSIMSSVDSLVSYRMKSLGRRNERQSRIWA